VPVVAGAAREGTASAGVVDTVAII
jgi:hypothetical protein